MLISAAPKKELCRTQLVLPFQFPLKQNRVADNVSLGKSASYPLLVGERACLVSATAADRDRHGSVRLRIVQYECDI